MPAGPANPIVGTPGDRVRPAIPRGAHRELPQARAPALGRARGSRRHDGGRALPGHPGRVRAGGRAPPGGSRAPVGDRRRVPAPRLVGRADRRGRGLRAPGGGARLPGRHGRARRPAVSLRAGPAQARAGDRDRRVPLPPGRRHEGRAEGDDARARRDALLPRTAERGRGGVPGRRGVLRGPGRHLPAGDRGPRRASAARTSSSTTPRCRATATSACGPRSGPAARIPTP